MAGQATEHEVHPVGGGLLHRQFGGRSPRRPSLNGLLARLPTRTYNRPIRLPVCLDERPKQTVSLLCQLQAAGFLAIAAAISQPRPGFLLFLLWLVSFRRHPRRQAQ